GKPVRQLTNKWSEEFEASGLQPLPMPFQSLIAFPILEGARQAGMKDIYPGIAGQSVALLNKIRPAQEIVEAMARPAIEIPSERTKAAGATDEEVAESIFVAMALRAGGSFAHSSVAMEALEHK